MTSSLSRCAAVNVDVEFMSSPGAGQPSCPARLGRHVGVAVDGISNVDLLIGPSECRSIFGSQWQLSRCHRHGIVAFATSPQQTSVRYRSSYHRSRKIDTNVIVERVVEPPVAQKWRPVFNAHD